MQAVLVLVHQAGLVVERVQAPEAVVAERVQVPGAAVVERKRAPGAAIGEQVRVPGVAVGEQAPRDWLRGMRTACSLNLPM